MYTLMLLLFDDKFSCPQYRCWAGSLKELGVVVHGGDDGGQLTAKEEFLQIGTFLVGKCPLTCGII